MEDLGLLDSPLDVWCIGVVDQPESWRLLSFSDILFSISTTTTMATATHCYKGNEVYSGDSEILHEIVRDTTRIPEEHELISVISRTISCIISESPLHFIYFLTVCAISIVITFNRMWADRGQKLALPSLLHPLSPFGMLTRHAKIRYEQLHPFSLSSDLSWPHPTTQYRTHPILNFSHPTPLTTLSSCRQSSRRCPALKN